MKTISQRAYELSAEGTPYGNICTLRLGHVVQALDEWQATVEERLVSLCEARAKECPHYEFMGGCWKVTGERACGQGCNCDCHRCASARSAEPVESATDAHSNEYDRRAALKVEREILGIFGLSPARFEEEKPPTPVESRYSPEPEEE